MCNKIEHHLVLSSKPTAHLARSCNRKICPLACIYHVIDLRRYSDNYFFLDRPKTFLEDEEAFFQQLVHYNHLNHEKQYDESYKLYLPLAEIILTHDFHNKEKAWKLFCDGFDFIQIYLYARQLTESETEGFFERLAYDNTYMPVNELMILLGHRVYIENLSPYFCFIVENKNQFDLVVSKYEKRLIECLRNNICLYLFARIKANYDNFPLLAMIKNYLAGLFDKEEIGELCTEQIFHFDYHFHDSPNKDLVLNIIGYNPLDRLELIL